MAIVQVPYNVRVWAVVDTDTGKVVRVVQNLESVELDLDSGALILDEHYDPIDGNPELRADAEGIAETAEWPAWDR